MNTRDKYTGFAIALAWPRTWCKQSNAWYDGLMVALGFSKNHYYRVGHAALVLIDKESSQCHYFDFGRYHSPVKYGRVRSAFTDHDLAINLKARISADGKNILNFNEILGFLHQNQACHGNEDLHGSYTEVDFQQAYNKAVKMQADSPWPYGPFIHKGTNCSRFVQTVILAGKPSLKHTMLLRFTVPLTPTPISNVKALSVKTRINGHQPWPLFSPDKKPSKGDLQRTLPAVKISHKIPSDARWISGEGAGSWFHITQRQDGYFHIFRYSPEGVMECNSVFRAAFEFDPSLPFEVVHLSHCAQVRVVQNEQKITLTRVEGALASHPEEAGILQNAEIDS